MGNKDEVLKIQTCTLKVNIHCDGCHKKVKKILQKIDGVYQSTIDAEQGKVIVSGLVDPDTIIKKLNKAGKPAVLWTSKPSGVASQFQKLHLDGGGKGQHPKDAGGKGDQHPNDAGGKGQKGSGGGSKHAKMAMTQPKPHPQQMQMKGPTPQQLQQLQQQMQRNPPTSQQLQQLQQQMQMKGLKLPQFMEPANMPFAAPAKNPRLVKFIPPEDDLVDEGGSEYDDELDEFNDGEDFDDDGLDDLYDDPKMTMKQPAMAPNACWEDKKGGKKSGGGNEIPVQIKGNGNNGGKKDAGGKQHLGGGGGGGQPNNVKGGVAPASENHPGQGKKDGGVGGPGPAACPIGPMGGGMPPQQAMAKPNMMSGACFPGMGQMSHPHMPSGRAAVQGMQPATGFYQGGGGGGMPSGAEVLQAAVAAGNPIAQHQYMLLLQQQHQQQQMTMMQQQQQPMMMANGGHGGGYPAYGRPAMSYPMPSYPAAPPPVPHGEPYNYSGDEEPHSCSVM